MFHLCRRRGVRRVSRRIKSKTKQSWTIGTSAIWMDSIHPYGCLAETFRCQEEYLVLLIIKNTYLDTAFLMADIEKASFRPAG
jgi:hypothetical protein